MVWVIKKSVLRKIPKHGNTPADTGWIYTGLSAERKVINDTCIVTPPSLKYRVCIYERVKAPSSSSSLTSNSSQSDSSLSSDSSSSDSSSSGSISSDSSFSSLSLSSDSSSSLSSMSSLSLSSDSSSSSSSDSSISLTSDSSISSSSLSPGPPSFCDACLGVSELLTIPEFAGVTLMYDGIPLSPVPATGGIYHRSWVVNAAPGQQFGVSINCTDGVPYAVATYYSPASGPIINSFFRWGAAAGDPAPGLVCSGGIISGSVTLPLTYTFGAYMGGTYGNVPAPASITLNF